MKTQLIDYKDNKQDLCAFYAVDDTVKGLRPAVLVIHDWSGRNDFAHQKAEMLAELGYIGIAIDVYGKGKLGNTNDEKSKLMHPFMENRQLLRQRLLAAVNMATQLENVDKTRMGAMGFCFGGLCALDLARSGAPLQGVVSFHGLLQAPQGVSKEKIRASVLALHGYDDPMGPPKDVEAFAREMTEANADWQMHLYGNTVHAFTNPLANDKAFGTVYNALAEKRSLLAMKNFWESVF